MAVVRRIFLLSTWVGLLLSISVRIAYAQTIDIEPSLSLSSVFSDNAQRSQHHQSSELVTKVSPSVILKGEGNKAQFSVIGRAEFATGGDDTEHFSPQLSSVFQSELIDNFAFLNANLQVSQSTVDVLSPSFDDPLNRREDRTQTYNYRIDPYIEKAYLNGNRFRVGAFLQGQQHDSDQVSDTDTVGGTVQFVRGVGSSPVTLSIGGSYRQTETRNTRSTFLVVKTGVGYKLSDQLLFNGSISNENNSFATQRSNPDGRSWQLGLRWTPSSRTELELSYADRFFGASPSLSFSHRIKRHLFEIRYRRDLADGNNLTEGRTVFDDVDAFGSSVDPFSRAPNSLNTNSLTEGAFINDKVNARWAIEGRRSKFGVVASYSKLDYENGQQGEEVSELSASFSRQLSRLSTVDIEVADKHASRGVSNVDDYKLRLGWDRRLGEKARVNVYYQFVDRRANNAGVSYQENSVQLQFITRL